MSDLQFEPMSEYETRLSRELRAASEHVLRSFDATAITRTAAIGHRRTGIGRRLDGLMPFPSAKQRHGSRRPWRFSPMSTSFKLAFGAAAVIAVALGGAFALGSRPPDNGIGGPGPTPSPAIRPSPWPTTSPATDTSTWKPFTSARHGFTVAVPPAFVSQPASKFWVIPEGPATSPAEWDLFFGGPGNNTWAASSIRVNTDITNDEWADAYREGQDDPSLPSVCAPSRQALTDVSIDGHSARLRVGCGDIEALVFADGRVWSFSGWTSNSGSPGVPDEFRSLFNTWLTTIKLDPDSALEPPPASPGPT
jgi:hypothetical protein